MDKYKVVKSFRDNQDNDHFYGASDSLYPRDGLDVSNERVNEIMEAGFIEAIEVEEIVEQTEVQQSLIPDESWTRDQIKEYLKGQDVEYKERDDKDTLLELAGV